MLNKDAELVSLCNAEPVISNQISRKIKKENEILITVTNYSEKLTYLLIIEIINSTKAGYITLRSCDYEPISGTLSGVWSGSLTTVVWQQLLQRTDGALEVQPEPQHQSQTLIGKHPQQHTSRPRVPCIATETH